MKTPKFLSKLSAVLTPRPKKKLQATARVARQTMEDYDSEEPTTKLSSAFIVVLILHVVAVGGIYAFNSIKASRRDRDGGSAKTSETAAPAATAKAVSPGAVAAPPAPAAGGTSAPTHKAEPVAAATAAAAAKPATGHQYEVKAGDSLTKIAFAYKTTPADIMAANQLKEGAVLRPGQSLVIPAPKAPAKPPVDAAKVAAAAAPPAAAATPAPPKQADIPPTKTTPGLYTVKKGDTLTSIAKTYGLTLDDISKANKITDPKKLQLGQVLKVPPRKS